MNYKNHSAIIAIIICLSNCPLTTLSKNPLDVLGLDQDATDTEIKKACRKLQKIFHTDKGGDGKQSVLINMACNDLDWRDKDDCKINSKSKFDECECLSREKSFCVQGFTNSSIRCNCSLSDSSFQSDYQNQFIGKNSSSSSSQQQSSSSSNNQQQQNTKHDNCFYESQSCTCSNTGQSGTCGFGTLKNGLYCQCPQPNQQSSSSSSQKSSSSQTPPPPQDECETSGFNLGSTCTCPKTGNKGTCYFNLTTLKQQCVCSDDECENNASKAGDSCTCPDNGKSGTCKSGTMKDGIYGYSCNCEDNSQQNSKSNTNSTYNSNFDTHQPPKPEPAKEYGALLVSPNIHAIIYNLGLQRSINPTTRCDGWYVSLSPFTQANKIDIDSNIFLHDYSVKSIEAGLLVNAGYYGSWGYARSLFSMQQINVSHEGDKAVLNQIFGIPVIDFVHDYGTQSRFGVLDTLLALGLKTNNADTWNLNGECFLGFSDQRIKPDNGNKSTSSISHIPNLGTGAQVNFDWTFSENCYSKYELSTLARLTYFIPIETIFYEPGTNNRLGTVSYSAGSFFDLLFGLKQYYGYDYEHQIDLGYNPTIHYGSKPTISTDNNDKAHLNVLTEYIPNLRHTFYGTYSYNVNLGRDVPVTVSAGGTATFAPRITPYGTLFLTCSLGF